MEGGELLCCDTCSLVFHVTCLRPEVRDPGRRQSSRSRARTSTSSRLSAVLVYTGRAGYRRPGGKVELCLLRG